MESWNQTAFSVICYDCAEQFLTVSDLGAFQHISYDQIKEKTHIATLRDEADDLVGLARLYESDQYNNIAISFLEVTKPGNRFGLLMLKKLFDYASDKALSKKTDIFVTADGFTEAGKIALLPELIRLGKKSPRVSFGMIHGC
ncbi:MAG: hypothetical protein ACPG05_01195 [Bdellovibrionales bacterium]